MTTKIIESHASFGGTQAVYEHAAKSTGTPMRFAVYTPPGEGPFPAVFVLSGLTCTEQNFITKAGAQRAAAALGLVLVGPDTSPRGEGVPDVEDWAFGQGAGFYVDATQAPWAEHFQMETYVTQELPEVAASVAPIDVKRLGITGHSMGGHGALTLGIRHPETFRSVSALAPISSPVNCPWGQTAFAGYLGDDRAVWAEHDACALLRSRGFAGALMIDQGLEDGFLDEQLKPELLEAACAETGVALVMRRHAQHDHSFYFVATFIDDHLRWHAERLKTS